MADINKTSFINTYGIDDDNFLVYLNKFGTLKKIVDMGRLDVISKEKLNHLYNRFIYYNSLGHTLDTIVNETTSDIRSLFFFNGNGYFMYILPPTNSISIKDNSSVVAISGRTCQVKLVFVANTEIKKDTLIFNLTPAPFYAFRADITTNTNNVEFTVNDDGIVLNNGSIPANTKVSGSITYIIKK